MKTITLKIALLILTMQLSQNALGKEVSCRSDIDGVYTNPDYKYDSAPWSDSEVRIYRTIVNGKTEAAMKVTIPCGNKFGAAYYLIKCNEFSSSMEIELIEKGLSMCYLGANPQLFIENDIFIWNEQTEEFEQKKTLLTISTGIRVPRFSGNYYFTKQ